MKFTNSPKPLNTKKRENLEVGGENPTEFFFFSENNQLVEASDNLLKSFITSLNLSL